MTTVDVLRKAKALYEANPSHARSGRLPESGTHCVVYALNHGSERDPLAYTPAEAAFREAIDEPIIRFNATHSTAEVLAAFDRAIEAEEAKARV